MLFQWHKKGKAICFILAFRKLHKSHYDAGLLWAFWAWYQVYILIIPLFPYRFQFTSGEDKLQCTVWHQRKGVHRSLVIKSGVILLDEWKPCTIMKSLSETWLLFFFRLARKRTGWKMRSTSKHYVTKLIYAAQFFGEPLTSFWSILYGNNVNLFISLKLNFLMPCLTRSLQKISPANKLTVIYLDLKLPKNSHTLDISK